MPDMDSVAPSVLAKWNMIAVGTISSGILYSLEKQSTGMFHSLCLGFSCTVRIASVWVPFKFTGVRLYTTKADSYQTSPRECLAQGNLQYSEAESKCLKNLHIHATFGAKKSVLFCCFACSSSVHSCVFGFYLLLNLRLFFWLTIILLIFH